MQYTHDYVRDKEEVLKKLESHRDYYQTMLNGLEAVKIKYKKDGSHFANINQNFENGKVTIPNYQDEFHKEFQYFARSDRQGYLSFSFPCYIYVDELPETDSRRERANPSERYVRQTYSLTAGEVIEKIKEQKIFAKKMIEQYDRQIEGLETIFPLVSEKLEELKQVIFNNCKDFRENPIFASSIEYALQDWCKSNIR